MSQNDFKCSLAQLEQGLVRLDEKLAALDLDAPIELRAIGGFALMSYGIRAADRAFTVDIDTVTADFAPEVTTAIREVAAELGLERDWINNDSVIDGEDTAMVEEMYDARWVPSGKTFAHIDLKLATVPTLTRAKIIAADVAEFSGRAQDVPDLLELLRYQGIETLAQFDVAYPDPYGEYEAASEIVAGQLTTVAA